MVRFDAEAYKARAAAVPLPKPDKDSLAVSLSIDQAEAEFKGNQLKEPAIKWHERAIDFLHTLDEKIDKIPTFRLQKELDKFGAQIEALLEKHKFFAPVRSLNKFLDEEHAGPWYEKLPLFLVKLPPRAIRNIVRIVYNVIKGVCYGVVHPLQGLNHAAQYIIHLIHALSKPKNIAKLGAGVIGASLGQMAMTGGLGPHAYIGLALGGGIFLTGLLSGAIKTIVKEDKDKLRAVGVNLWNVVKEVPESMLTGFIVGVVLGAIQHHVQKTTNVQTHTAFPNTQAGAEQYVNQFLSSHGIPAVPPPTVTLLSNGNITITWTGPGLTNLTHFPAGMNVNTVPVYTAQQGLHLPPTSFTITLLAKAQNNLNVFASWQGPLWSCSKYSSVAYPTGPIETVMTSVAVHTVGTAGTIGAAALTMTATATNGRQKRERKGT